MGMFSTQDAADTRFVSIWLETHQGEFVASKRDIGKPLDRYEAEPTTANLQALCHHLGQLNWAPTGRSEKPVATLKVAAKPIPVAAARAVSIEGESLILSRLRVTGLKLIVDVTSGEMYPPDSWSRQLRGEYGELWMISVDHLRRNHPLLKQLAGATPRAFFTVITSFTLALLVFHGYQHIYFEVPFQLLFVAFLVVPQVHAQAPFWFLIACFSGAALWLDWWSADNHKYLLFYWVMTVFLACEQGEQKQLILVKTARYLLFFTMTLAVVQKSLSPDYLSGAFFQFTPHDRWTFQRDDRPTVRYRPRSS